MKKRIFAVLLLTAMLITALPITVTASIEPLVFECNKSFYDKLLISGSNDYTYNSNGYIEMTGITNVSGDYNHIPIFEGISMLEKDYRYMAIKYKYDKAYSNAALSLYNPSFSRTKNGAIRTVADGEWHTQIVDLYAVRFETNSSLWGSVDTRTINKLWLMPFGWDKQFGGVFSLEYIGFFNTETAATAYTQKVDYKGCQIGLDKQSIRFLGTVDTENLNAMAKVGFKITASYDDGGDKSKIWTSDTTTVYSSVLADGKQCAAQDLSGKYIYAFEITDVPQDMPITFTVIPTRDGTELTDKQKTVELDKGINGEYESVYVDSAYLDELDEKSDALKSNIVNSENTVNTDTWDSGTVYYVSNNGSDNNSGTSPDEAWATLSKVNEAAFNNGDAVLFERGDTWRGCLIAQSGVTYSSYGTGDKPQIYGSPENGADASKWTQAYTSGNMKIWKYNTDLTDVGNIVFDEGAASEDFGYRVFWNYSVNGDTITRKIRYGDVTLGTNESDLSGFTQWSSVFKKDLYFLSLPKITDNSTVGNYASNGYKYNTGALYLRCDAGNPGEIYSSIEFGALPTSGTSTNTNGHIVNVLSNMSGSPITIDNLCIKFGGAHGIGGGDNKNLTVTNCEIGWIGGTVHAWANSNGTYNPTSLGNAVEVVRNCVDFTVSNNWIYQCYDTGITNQTSNNNGVTKNQNIKYDGNLIDYCDMAIEIWYGASNSTSADYGMNNVQITNNICRFIGYGICEARNNFAVGAGIQTAWGGTGANNKASDYVIKNNTFFITNGYCQTLWIISGDEAWLPDLEGNTYVDIYGRRLGMCRAKTGNDWSISYAEHFTEYLYDGNVGDVIKNIFKDTTAKVAVLPNASYVINRYKHLYHDSWHQGVSLTNRYISLVK